MYPREQNERHIVPAPSKAPWLRERERERERRKVGIDEVLDHAGMKKRDLPSRKRDKTEAPYRAECLLGNPPEARGERGKYAAKSPMRET